MATVEIRRPPNNHFDADLIGRLAGAWRTWRRTATPAPSCCAATGGTSAPVPTSAAGAREPRAGPARRPRLFRQPLPVVAAVQGAAIGGGLGLALAADLRVVAPEARFAANFKLLGFHPGFGISVTLPSGRRPAGCARAATTGRRIDGEEALRIGLADRLVPGGDLRSAAAPWPPRWRRPRPGGAGDPGDAAGHGGRRGGGGGRPRAAVQQRLMRTADFREGVAAVAERRPGRFTGR